MHYMSFTFIENNMKKHLKIRLSKGMSLFTSVDVKLRLRRRVHLLLAANVKQELNSVEFV